MKHYNLMPNGGDWFGNQDVINQCGSLYPIITSEKNAIAYAKKVKKLFPNISFVLTEGETWGNQTLVKEF